MIAGEKVMSQRQIRVCTWEQCQAVFREMEEAHNNQVGIGHLLFRGQSNTEWGLNTSLERHGDSNKTCPLSLYYKYVMRLKPEIECYSALQWPDTVQNEIIKWTGEYEYYSLGQSLPAYEYLVYLRHHGFPSPLLDWSKSPYVASYFAFANAKADNDVAVFVYSQGRRGTDAGSSDLPVIHLSGSHIRAHKRHFRQQSCYTTCASYDAVHGWVFVPHQRFLDENFLSSNSVYKVIISSTLRQEILRFLDKFNLNAFTLFEDEESLMKTLAFRLNFNPFV
jgi:hypothetical protein